MTAPDSVAAFRRYSGSTVSASISSARSATQNASQSNPVSSHLCGSKQYESAVDSPLWIQRYSGQTAAAPAYAASTCSHAPAAAAIGPISVSGSIAVVDVVPTVATTSAGTLPAARSASMAARNEDGSIACVAGSTATVRTAALPRPAIRAAFAIDECPCVEV